MFWRKIKHSRITRLENFSSTLMERSECVSDGGRCRTTTFVFFDGSFIDFVPKSLSLSLCFLFSVCVCVCVCVFWLLSLYILGEDEKLKKRRDFLCILSEDEKLKNRRDKRVTSEWRKRKEKIFDGNGGRNGWMRKKVGN
ncbi:hypothetical protein ACB092_12G029000 [Castanea dentata]